MELQPQEKCIHTSLIFLITKMKSILKNKGFSILEMLIYVSILTIMLAVIMGVTISIIRSVRVVNALREIESSAIVSFERISRETRLADSIDLAESDFDVADGRLVLIGVDEDNNPRTVEFYLDDGSLMVEENGVEPGSLTQAEAEVTSLIFRHFSGENSEGVRTEISIESGTSTHYRSDNFYFGTLLR